MERLLLRAVRLKFFQAHDMNRTLVAIPECELVYGVVSPFSETAAGEVC